MYIVRLEPITAAIYASGHIISENQYEVFANNPGILQKTLAHEGELVKVGQPLFIIKHLASSLQEENAQLAAEYASRNTRGDRLAEQEATIDLAKRKMNSDSLLYKRQQELWAEGIGSALDLEQREMAYVASANSYRIARNRYRDLKKQLDFTAAQSSKLLEISKSQTADFILKSRINGTIYRITAEEGEMVSTQQSMAIIGKANAFIAELQVDEKDIVKIKTGQKVYLSMDSYPDSVYIGRVSRIYPIMNEKNRTFELEAIFENPPSPLFPNLTLEANIVYAEKEQVLTIPRSYLIRDSFVMMEKESLVRVWTGLKDYEKVEIIKGLKAGDVILKTTK
ncbi:MAG: efflux RND transporter periplasmic adaptor subunit [Saprospiraceae bacterium]|nr:efflux RND transporter periplasmic adaptor subunit [Saprospiraceae bacterium]